MRQHQWMEPGVEGAQFEGTAAKEEENRGKRMRGWGFEQASLVTAVHQGGIVPRHSGVVFIQYSISKRKS